MLQFTDLHLDLDYVPGSAKVCDDILCCRAYAGFPEEKENQASPWGEYECDLPFSTFAAMGDFIREEIKPDLIAWTGDVPPHDMWNYNLDYVKKYQGVMTDFFKANFSDFSLYPLEGNHDFGDANC